MAKARTAAKPTRQSRVDVISDDDMADIIAIMDDVDAGKYGDLDELVDDEDEDDVEIVDLDEDDEDEDEDEDDEDEFEPVRKSKKSSASRNRQPKPVSVTHSFDAIPTESWQEFFFESATEELSDDEGLTKDGKGYFWRFTLYPEDIDNFDELHGLTTVDIIDIDSSGRKYLFKAY